MTGANGRDVPEATKVSRTKIVLAKPTEHQCSVATISAGLGSNSGRISPPHVPCSKGLAPTLLSEWAQCTSTLRSRRDDIGDECVEDASPALRAAFSNWRTSETDTDRVFDALVQATKW